MCLFYLVSGLHGCLILIDFSRLLRCSSMASAFKQSCSTARAIRHQAWIGPGVFRRASRLDKSEEGIGRSGTDVVLVGCYVEVGMQKRFARCLMHGTHWCWLRALRTHMCWKVDMTDDSRGLLVNSSLVQCSFCGCGWMLVNWKTIYPQDLGFLYAWIDDWNTYGSVCLSLVLQD